MPKQKKRSSLLPQNLATAIKKHRLAKKMTQSQLAEKVGVETESISRLERG
jgi:transcriptional regulator with XRE-family HTH domain